MIWSWLLFVLSSLLQDSPSPASEDSNSLFSEVCPYRWCFIKSTPLSRRLCLTHCFSGLSPSYGSCCLWNALLCCRIRPPQSPTQMTASRYLQVRAVRLWCHQLPPPRTAPSPKNQSLPPSPNRRGRPGRSKGLQWKGVWTWYTSTSPVCAELWECQNPLVCHQ